MNHSRSLLPLIALCFFFAACDDDNEHTIDLPTVIDNYLAANYGNYEIEESETDTLCTGTAVYEVELEVSNDKEVDLTFDTEGNLLFTEVEIASGGLPAEVVASIADNFNGYSAGETERLDLADGSNQYEVELKKGQEQIEVLFAADGKVICQEQGDDDGE
jgi:uncharacterized membrane protein YkoI